MKSLADADLATLTEAARQFLAGHRWCGEVVSVVPVFAVLGVVGLFRCALVPRQPDADVMVWVVVGDLPPAYLVHEPGDSWQDALSGYVFEMRRWVEAVRAGATPGADIIPVNGAPTQANADQLATRLDFLQTHLVEVDPTSVESDV